MSVVEVDERFRITIPRKLRRAFPVWAGEKLYVIAAGDMLILRKISEDPSARLHQLLGNLRFGREVRRRAEEWMLKEAKEKP